MESIRHARTAGTVGIVAGVLWIISWAVHAVMAPKIGSGNWYAEQAVATVALFGSAFLLFGLAWARTAGDGKIVRTILVINAIAWLLLGVATASAVITGDEWGGALGGVLFPVGGMLSAPAAVVTGIIIAVKRRLGGWQRWTPLVFGIGYGIMLNLQGSADDRSAGSLAAYLAEYVLILVVAIALWTAPFVTRHDPSRPEPSPAYPAHPVAN
jgi:hypothetical protein